MKKLSYFILVSLLATQVITGQNTAGKNKVQLSEDLYQKALQYFAEAKQLSDQDDGQLWGKQLYGPMMFIKFPEQLLIANQSDPKGYLKPQGEVYVGKLPKNIGIANTAQRWNGKKWTTVIWFKFSPTTRTSLFMHELFHRIQPNLGFKGKTNVHLDEREARILIRLEWNALLAANLKLLKTDRTKEAMKGAHQDVLAALTFRAYRHQLYNTSKYNEDALEMNEGLAEYTGVKLSGMDQEQIKQALIRSVKQSNKRRTLVRSFAYISGPLYGFLLDHYAPKWRKQLVNGKGFTEALRTRLSLSIPSTPKTLRKQVKHLGKHYQAKEIRAFEKDREAKRKQLLKKYQASLINGLVLKINLTKKFRYTFNPSTLVPFKGKGVVYPTITVRDEWGILTVTNGGALMSSNKTSITIPAKAKLDQANSRLETKNWTLELKPGWEVTKEGQHWGIKRQ